MAAIGGFLVIEAPIFKVTLANNAATYLLAANSLLLYALIIGIACLCVIAIFLFKKRPTQARLCIISIILAIGAVALEVKNVEDFKKASPGMVKGTYQLGALLPILMIIFLIMAVRGIYKDQKLVKSLDRLR
jgi:1,4-dihydroxy-2-naphthoate octaprenyltransferase